MLPTQSGQYLSRDQMKRLLVKHPTRERQLVPPVQVLFLDFAIYQECSHEINVV